MNWNNRIRQTHRWLSVVFTLAVMANMIGFAVGQGQPPPAWVTYSPLPPLGIMWLTGMYLFVRPYAVKWREGQAD